MEFDAVSDVKADDIDVTVDRLHPKAIKVGSGKTYGDTMLAIASEKGLVVIDTGTTVRATRAYRAQIEEVDWSAGQILDTLRDLKLDKHTMVIFTSDNGGQPPVLLRAGRGPDPEDRDQPVVHQHRHRVRLPCVTEQRVRP